MGEARKVSDCESYVLWEGTGSILSIHQSALGKISLSGASVCPRNLVLVIWNGLQSILVSTNVDLSPIQIIEGYATRFKIENMFRALNQSFGGLCYHFWTKRTKKINRYKKKDDPNPLEQVTDENDKQLILGKMKAIEGFILVSSIAMGITQMLSLNLLFENDLVKCRWIRTPARLRVSEGTVAYYMRKFFFVHMAKRSDSFITHFIIEAQQEGSHKSEDI